MSPYEYTIQVGIADHLKGQRRIGNKTYPGNPPFPGLLFTHAFQGRSKEEGYYLKALGVRAGIFDIPLWWENPRKAELEKLNLNIPLYEAGMLEVKRPKEGYSDSQKEIKPILERLGMKHGIVHSVREAHDMIISWGLIAAHNTIFEVYDKREVAEAFKREMFKRSKDDQY